MPFVGLFENSLLDLDDLRQRGFPAILTPFRVIGKLRIKPCVKNIRRLFRSSDKLPEAEHIRIVENPGVSGGIFILNQRGIHAGVLVRHDAHPRSADENPPVVIALAHLGGNLIGNPRIIQLFCRIAFGEIPDLTALLPQSPDQCPGSEEFLRSATMTRPRESTASLDVGVSRWAMTLA